MFRQTRVLSLIILLFAAFLRFFKLGENFAFAGEIGDNLLDIKNAFESRQIPLLGPPTSHPWLSFGPLFYWLYGPLLALAGFNPVSHAYFGAFISLLIIPVNFFVVKVIFNNRVALLSSFLIAISPLYSEFARSARFFSLVPLLIYPFLFFLHKVLEGEKRYLFWVAVVLGITLNFHYTPLVLIPFAATVLLIKKVKITRGDIAASLFGFLIPFTPVLLNELLQGGLMIPKLFAWIPYRLLGFLGLYPKNTISISLLKDNLDSIIRFFHLSFLSPDQTVLALLLVLILDFYILWKTASHRLNFSWIFLLTWLGWGFLALFIHGSPPIHYFVPLFPLPILFFSLLLTDLWKDKRIRAIVFFGLLTLAFINLRFFLSKDWFYRQQDEVVLAPHHVPYKLQLEISGLIIKDAQGESFSLTRVGPYDQFEENYSQNYRYLLWWLGNEPKEYVSKLRYTVYEDEKRIPAELAEGEAFFRISNMVILRTKK